MDVRLDRVKQCITPFENAFMAEVDGPQWVNLTDANRFVAVMRNLIAGVRDRYGGTQTFVVSEHSKNRNRFHVSVVQAREQRKKDPFLFSDEGSNWNQLCVMATQDGFELNAQHGGHLSLSFDRVGREPIPCPESAWNLFSDETSWEERYQILQSKAKWSDLRSRAYRYAPIAQAFANACSLRGKLRVLCPAVGFCIDPWILAHAGLEVEAIDISPTAIAMLKSPEKWQGIYSQNAWKSWEAEECRNFGGFLDGYNSLQDPIPDLNDRASRAILEERVRFHTIDQRQLPFTKHSIDAVFACNALPRKDSWERKQVIDEWCRVLKPNGILFLTLHNAFAMDEDLEGLLKSQNFQNLPAFRTPRDMSDKWKRHLLDRPNQGYYSLFQTSG